MELDITRNYHKDNPNSNEAFKRSRGNSKEMRIKIMRLLEKADPLFGLTCEEIEELLREKHQSVSARISELKAEKLIRAVSKKKTSSGSLADSYVRW